MPFTVMINPAPVVGVPAGTNMVLSLAEDGVERAKLQRSAGANGNTFLANVGTGEIRLRPQNSSALDVIVSSAGLLTLPIGAVAGNTIAVPVGGSAAAFIQLGPTAGFGIYWGSGAPTVVAQQGSLYISNNGATAATRLYTATNSAGAWTNLTAAA